MVEKEQYQALKKDSVVRNEYIHITLSTPELQGNPTTGNEMMVA
jgi:hypothetical protein